MKIIYFLLLFNYAFSNKEFDIEMEGKLHIGDDLMMKLIEGLGGIVTTEKQKKTTSIDSKNKKKTTTKLDLQKLINADTSSSSELDVKSTNSSEDDNDKTRRGLRHTRVTLYDSNFFIDDSHRQPKRPLRNINKDVKTTTTGKGKLGKTKKNKKGGRKKRSVQDNNLHLNEIQESKYTSDRKVEQTKSDEINCSLPNVLKETDTTDKIKLNKMFIEDNNAKLKFNENSVEENSSKKQINFAKAYFMKKAMPSSIRAFLDIVLENGVKQIKSMGKYLQRNFSEEENFITFIQENITSIFKSDMNCYISQSFKRNIFYNIDRQYQYLDLISTLNMYLYDLEIKMLNSVSARLNIDKSVTKVITDIVYTQNVAHMKKEMDFLCEKINICRPYPGYFELFADLINEILTLNDMKLSHVVKLSSDIIKEKRDFFKIFIRNDLIETVTSNLLFLMQDISQVREFLTNLRLVINHRYKFAEVHDEVLKIKTKALRLLFDIIDENFNGEIDELTTITFSATVKDLCQWKKGDIQTIFIPVQLFIDNFVRVMKTSSTKNDVMEIMTLIELILTGSAINKELYLEMFTKGPKFLQESQ